MIVGSRIVVIHTCAIRVEFKVYSRFVCLCISCFAFYPQIRVPKFFAFDKFDNGAVFGTSKDDFCMGPVCVGERCHDVGCVTIGRPFGMVERVA